MFDRMGFHFRPILSPLSLSHAHTNSLQTHPLACISLSPLSDFLLPSPQRQHHLLVHFLSLLLPLLHTYTHTHSHSFTGTSARAHTLMFSLTAMLSVSFSLFFVTIFFFCQTFYLQTRSFGESDWNEAQVGSVLRSFNDSNPGTYYPVDSVTKKLILKFFTVFKNSSAKKIDFVKYKNRWHFCYNLSFKKRPVTVSVGLQLLQSQVEVKLLSFFLVDRSKKIFLFFNPFFPPSNRRDQISVSAEKNDKMISEFFWLLGHDIELVWNRIEGLNWRFFQPKVILICPRFFFWKPFSRIWRNWNQEIQCVPVTIKRTVKRDRRFKYY